MILASRWPSASLHRAGLLERQRHLNYPGMGLMTMRFSRRPPATLFAGCLALCAGCQSLGTRLPLPAPAVMQACEPSAGSQRDHVHIFLIHGLDPLDLANLAGVRDYINDLGFRHTYYGPFINKGSFEVGIDRVHREDPAGRVVLIGFSLGAGTARTITQDLKEQGIRVALLVYLDGNTLDNVPRDRPENAERIVNVVASAYLLPGAQLDGAENIHEEDVWHFGAPTHPRTLEMLAQQLSSVAAAILAQGAAVPRPSTASEVPAVRAAERAAS